ncbi:MAG TPA: hypothetical protein VFM72_06460 [Aequorivita sp.]|nr:hypothetical protein [Aequorivita sp.]
MNNILITGIGGPTPRSIALRLRKLYPNARLIGTDTNNKAIGFYLEGLLDKKYLVPKAHDDEYWTAMKNIVANEKIDLAFIQPELEVLKWGEYFKKHKTYICSTLIPPLEYTQNLMDKARMAALLKDTSYIPKTIEISPVSPRIEMVEGEIGYPCWIRAAVGSGGLGSLKIKNRHELESWLFIHKDVEKFTISEFLTGRHLANQMLYLNGKCVKNAGLHCVNYVMADIAPSKVTGNTSYGKLINEPDLLKFCEEVMDYISDKLEIKPNGVYSFDLKEDENGNLKVTEINIRHMAYTGVMAQVGFDLIEDTVHFLCGEEHKIISNFKYDKDYIFLRDVDIQPIIMKESDLL